MYTDAMPELGNAGVDSSWVVPSRVVISGRGRPASRRNVNLGYVSSLS